MPNSAQSNIPNAVTRTLICVDSAENGDISGMMYNPYLPEPVKFSHITALISSMESFFNDIAYPQSFYEDRSFLSVKDVPEQEPKPPAAPTRFREDELFSAHTGLLATFEVEVRSRLNVTWQGTLAWKERGESRAFQSTLELLKMMDHAITKGSLTAS